MAEALAASELLDRDDPTLLTYAEIRDSYGTPINFFHSFGLKPWNPEDCEEARAISRAMKEEMLRDQEEQSKSADQNRGGSGGRKQKSKR